MKCFQLDTVRYEYTSHLTRGAWIEIITEYFGVLLVISRTSHEVRGLKYITNNFIVPLLRRTSHEVRGLKFRLIFFSKFAGTRRTSHEVRGLKFFDIIVIAAELMSHLTRGAWIEIVLFLCDIAKSTCRTSHEVRGLKYPLFLL